MTPTEWDTRDDAGAMLDFLWKPRGVGPHAGFLVGGDVTGRAAAAADDFDRRLHRY